MAMPDPSSAAVAKAREVVFWDGRHRRDDPLVDRVAEALDAFAAARVRAEREACARGLELQAARLPDADPVAIALRGNAAAIRVRGGETS